MVHDIIEQKLAKSSITHQYPSSIVHIHPTFIYSNKTHFADVGMQCSTQG